MPRAMDKEEVMDQVLRRVEGMVDEWERYPHKTTRERLEGVIYSFLALLDGCDIGIPGFIVAPLPSKEDSDLRGIEGSAWFPDNTEAENVVQCDLGGTLHDE